MPRPPRRPIRMKLSRSRLRSSIAPGIADEETRGPSPPSIGLSWITSSPARDEPRHGGGRPARLRRGQGRGNGGGNQGGLMGGFERICWIVTILASIGAIAILGTALFGHQLAAPDQAVPGGGRGGNRDRPLYLHPGDSGPGPRCAPARRRQTLLAAPAPSRSAWRRAGAAGERRRPPSRLWENPGAAETPIPRRRSGSPAPSQRPSRR